MKKILFAFAMLITMAACNSKPVEAEYTVAKNYFFKNGQEIPENKKITQEEEFYKLFGMATTMGENGKPTAIDFSKQFVIAVVLPVTNRDTEIIPEKVLVKGDKLFFYYNIKARESLSYSIQPVSIIILDKQYEDKTVNLVPYNI